MKNKQKVRFEADFEGNSEREEKEKKKKKTPITNCKIEIEINTLIHAYHKLLAVISQSKCLPPS